MSAKGWTASHMGRWKWNSDNTVSTWVWDFDADWAKVTDITNRRYELDTFNVTPQHKGTFHLSITTQGDPLDPYMFMVKLCGTTGKGATRYRYFRDYVEAHECALRWLDRRFKVEVPDA